LLRLHRKVHTRFSKDSTLLIDFLVSHCRDNGPGSAAKAVEMAGKGPNLLLLMVSG